MKYERLSLIYPATYLLLGGLAAMAFPDQLVRLFHSPFSYPEVTVQFVGVLSFVLGFLIALTVYKRLDVLYLPLLGLRLFVGLWLLVFYFSQRDIMFLVMFIVGGLGVALSLASLVLDKKNKPYEIN